MKCSLNGVSHPLCFWVEKELLTAVAVNILHYCMNMSNELRFLVLETTFQVKKPKLIMPNNKTPLLNNSIGQVLLRVDLTLTAATATQKMIQRYVHVKSKIKIVTIVITCMFNQN